MTDHIQEQRASPLRFIRLHLGTRSYLTVFLWSLGVLFLSPARLTPLAAGVCLVVAALVFPLSLRRLLQLRWLAFLALLALPPVFYVGELDRSLAGIAYSSAGLETALQIACRFLVFLVVLDGLAAAIDIPAVAGLLERFGLRGLGFSIGVALNLLPILQQSSQNTWRSLEMRGGFRKQRWRAAQLLGVTILANALARAEEISLAAEARAFSPEKVRALPVQEGALDLPIAILALASVVGLIVLRQ